jgi:hypothetical protein
LCPPFCSATDWAVVLTIVVLLSMSVVALQCKYGGVRYPGVSKSATNVKRCSTTLKDAQ